MAWKLVLLGLVSEMFVVPSSAFGATTPIAKWPARLASGEAVQIESVAVAPTGTIVAAGHREPDQSYLLWFSDSGRLLRAMNVSANGSATPEDGRFRGIGGVAVDSAGELVVSEPGLNRVQVLTSSGAFVRSFGVAGEFTDPEAVAASRLGEVAVGDRFRVQRFSAGGAAGGAFSQPTLGGAGSLAFDDAGAIVVPAPALGRVLTIAPDGTVRAGFAPREDVFGFGPNFGHVAAGAPGTLWLSDPSRRVVRQYSSSGAVLKTCVIGDPEQRQDLVPPSRALEPGPLAMGAGGDLVVASQSAKGGIVWLMRSADRRGAPSCLRPRVRLRVSLWVRSRTVRSVSAARWYAEVRVSRRAKLRVHVVRCRRPGRCRDVAGGSVTWRVPNGRSRRALPLGARAGRGRYVVTVTDANSQSSHPGRASATFVVT